ncbi:lipoyl(octanoyl) transferase LipB [Enterobacteriaceae endosymbiont of Donacia tomentosa]|uniref:lipoyl(octanoyl) transferase LipB n=1 Tax=Enterobacteriaceae endosymbiont of Donacia tomentosa TaxID=2675787 RepID=UPI001449C903|nr:lipoyl(octanoyl) transferase LipB [Enterobacteriaceae endosymbiont of Donacia tomentosa]QJC31526.1 lipoyl(octanoyl) transferase LipB [Enterobacteriaceae endosymbiont of Donacia tomentosa]
MYKKNFIIRYLGIEPWNITYKKMCDFSLNRFNNSLDEIWLVEHTPVFTNGRASTINNMINYHHNIPLFSSDRGGKITYHAPGQQIMYILINIKKRNLNIRSLIFLLEKTITNILLYFNIHSDKNINNHTPGVYINKKKIASIGLKISKGYTSHGISFNVNMNLSPFKYIYPCGFKKLKMTQLKNFVPNIKISIIKKLLIREFIFLINKYNF